MFKIRPFESRTISWWLSQRDDIDFDPPYQRRGRVWTTDDKAFLIDSILNDFDIPKFYLADFSYTDSALNLSKTQFAVIDGKQRFEAIRDFADGRIRLKKDFVYADDPSLALRGLTYKDLLEGHPKVAAKFENFNLTVMSVLTDEESKINDLFIRLNTSRPLTAPEYRNAMKGVVPPLIRDLADHSFFTVCISFKTNRGEDRQVAAKFLLVEFLGELVDTKRSQLDRLVAEATRAEAAESEVNRAAGRCADVLGGLAEVFSHRDPLLRSQGPLVVYYWLVRNLGPDPLLRSFLVAFEEARAANRKAARKSSMNVDAELLQYDSLNRSINDVGSLRGRYEILSMRFVDWRSTDDPASRGPVPRNAQSPESSDTIATPSSKR